MNRPLHPLITIRHFFQHQSHPFPLLSICIQLLLLLFLVLIVMSSSGVLSQHHPQNYPSPSPPIHQHQQKNNNKSILQRRSSPSSTTDASHPTTSIIGETFTNSSGRFRKVRRKIVRRRKLTTTTIISTTKHILTTIHPRTTAIPKSEYILTTHRPHLTTKIPIKKSITHQPTTTTKRTTIAKKPTTTSKEEEEYEEIEVYEDDYEEDTTTSKVVVDRRKSNYSTKPVKEVKPQNISNTNHNNWFPFASAIQAGGLLQSNSSAAVVLNHLSKQFLTKLNDASKSPALKTLVNDFRTNAGPVVMQVIENAKEHSSPETRRQFELMKTIVSSMSPPTPTKALNQISTKSEIGQQQAPAGEASLAKKNTLPIGQILSSSVFLAALSEVLRSLGKKGSSSSPQQGEKLIELLERTFPILETLTAGVNQRAAHQSSQVAETILPVQTVEQQHKKENYEWLAKILADIAVVQLLLARKHFLSRYKNAESTPPPFGMIPPYRTASPVAPFVGRTTTPKVEVNTDIWSLMFEKLTTELTTSLPEEVLHDMMEAWDTDYNDDDYWTTSASFLGGCVAALAAFIILMIIFCCFCCTRGNKMPEDDISPPPFGRNNLEKPPLPTIILNTSLIEGAEREEYIG